VIIDQHYLWVLVALDAALLMMILAGLAKKRLEWKRPVAQPIARRQRDESHRPSIGPLPGWMRDMLAAGTGVGGAVAVGANLAGAAVPPAVLAYIAAGVLLLLVTR
jgi:hypothetical protein